MNLFEYNVNGLDDFMEAGIIGKFLILVSWCINLVVLSAIFGTAAFVVIAIAKSIH